MGPYDAKLLAPQPYVRVAGTESNVIQLQIAVREFVPLRGRGSSIWLVGVSHVGESNYYAALQRKLDAQTLVLFEGISGHGLPGEPDETPSPAGTSLSERNSRSSLQTSLAASLGLVFQLEAIDYERLNFRNCDLSIQQLRQILVGQRTAQGEPGSAANFEGLLQLMGGGSWLDSLLQAALRFLGTNPKLQALGRLMLIDILDQIQGDPSQWHDLPSNLKQLLEVLLQGRNEHVIAELKAELPRLGRHSSVAVFYGVGHMPDLEQRLRQQLNYAPAKQFWLTAFSVDLKHSGVTEAERQLVDRLVKSQLQ